MPTLDFSHPRPPPSRVNAGRPVRPARDLGSLEHLAYLEHPEFDAPPEGLRPSPTGFTWSPSTCATPAVAGECAASEYRPQPFRQQWVGAAPVEPVTGQELQVGRLRFR